MPSSHSRAEKKRRLRALLARTGAMSLVLSSHEAVSWYLDGVRTHVSLAGPPVAAVRVSPEEDRILVATNEAERLIAEELLPQDRAYVVRVPWDLAPAQAALAEGYAVAESALAADLRALRAALTPDETDRYRALCRESARVLTDVAAAASASMSEREVAAALAAGLIARGIDPIVLLVAGEWRVPHRHPLPTASPLGRRAMLVVGGRRHGLIANATRWVGEPHPDDERILAVEAAYLDATRPGMRLDEIFAVGAAAYAAAGFGPREWQRHHQGGPTGYAGRDPRATAATTDVVQENHAFAWNPTAPGVKAEDTVLATSGGIEVLTVDPRWPTVHVDGRMRPAVMPFR
ncbi:M24 family metallopeptidase [Microbacterium sp. 22242]|uniref:M24 family metallopeptidase n=1 Tax=Microbacterium sp. 22242 TaxID=3453896 RepID=UPI003F8506C1